MSVDRNTEEGVRITEKEYDEAMVGVVTGAPGWTKKATRMGRTIGIAMEEWNCSANSSTPGDAKAAPGVSLGGSCRSRITVFLNLSYYLGMLNDDGTLLTIDRDLKINNLTAKRGLFEQTVV